MIRAVGWYYSGRCGVWVPGGGACSWKRAAPGLAESQELLAMIGRPIRFFSKMTCEAQMCLCAAHLALQASEWQGDCEIGLLSGGGEGCLAAQNAYFEDYLGGGRTLGRASLFVYTLPTSALSAVSLGLGLTGPTLHLHDDGGVLAAFVRHGREMVAGGEAQGMLALYSDPRAAVCVAIDGAEEMGYGDEHRRFQGLAPLALAQFLESMIAE